MSPAKLVPDDALDGVDVGFSMSESADLAQLGLAPKHVELAIGELARAVLVAGGRITYGGRIKPWGYTQVLMGEVRRFGELRHSVTICLALPEHRRLSLADLDEVQDELGEAGELCCLDEDGRELDDREAGRGSKGEDIRDRAVLARSYTGLRRHLASSTSARVVVGGKLSGYLGAMPGVVEEAITSIEAGQPLYVAGGFGGAAAAVAQVLKIDDLSWAPSGFPLFEREDAEVSGALDQVRAAAKEHGWKAKTDGLRPAERSHLAATYRPGDIASLVVNGLSRVFA